MLQNFIIDESVVRSKSVLDAIKRDPTGETWVVIGERSLVTNAHTFIHQNLMDGKITDLQHHLLCKKSFDFFDILTRDYDLVPCGVLLDDEVGSCLTRIQRRNRAGEEGIDESYLVGLIERYRHLYDPENDQLNFSKTVISLSSFYEGDTDRIDLNRLTSAILDFVRIK